MTEALAIHERLWPRLPHRRPARPPAPDGWPLPPEAPDARTLSGAVLRRWCVAVLRRHGVCSLRELRALLVLYGTMQVVSMMSGSHGAQEPPRVILQPS